MTRQGSPAAGRVAADLRPQLDQTPLSVARFPAGWTPNAWPAGFAAMVVDDTETTVVAATAALAASGLETAAVAVEPGWRRITFPGPLPWELVGFLADVAERLAAAHIPFTSVSGFSVDHLLVRAAHTELALRVLSGEPAPPQRPGTNP